MKEHLKHISMREYLRHNACWLSLFQIIVSVFLFLSFVVNELPTETNMLGIAVSFFTASIAILAKRIVEEKSLRQATEPELSFLAVAAAIILPLGFEYHLAVALFLTTVIALVTLTKAAVEARHLCGKVLFLWGFHLITPIAVVAMGWSALTWPFISAQLVILCAIVGINAIWFFACRPHWFEKVPSSFPSFM